MHAHPCPGRLPPRPRPRPRPPAGLALGFLVSPSRIPRKQQTRARSKRKLAMLEAMGIATQGLADAAEKEAKKAKKPARASSTGFIAAYTAILSVVLFGWLYEYGNVF